MVRPNQNDVLFGRGNRTTNHKGNKVFRCKIEEYKQAYMESLAIKEKQAITETVYHQMINEVGARFLTKEMNKWVHATEKAVMRKIAQALREKTKPPRTSKISKVPSLPVVQQIPSQEIIPMVSMDETSIVSSPRTSSYTGEVDSVDLPMTVQTPWQDILFEMEEEGNTITNMSHIVSPPLVSPPRPASFPRSTNEEFDCTSLEDPLLCITEDPNRDVCQGNKLEEFDVFGRLTDV